MGDVGHELLCPLCGYNLRGLSTCRCPECGFAFTWRELLEAEKNRQNYLFEYGRGRNFKTFWKTYWRTCRPRRFWTDVNPAVPVRLVRLVLYWVISVGITAACMCGTFAKLAVRMAIVNHEDRVSYATSPQAGGLGPYPRLTTAQINAIDPMPWQWFFWQRVFTDPGGRSNDGPNVPSGIEWAMLLASWPWLTLICLYIFRISMRQAKIRMVHLLRAVVYCTDFGLLFSMVFLILYFAGTTLSDGSLCLCSALLCSAITTYRLTIAFRKYLRVHLPFATVLASQIIAVLAVFVLLVQIADFSRRI